MAKKLRFRVGDKVAVTTAGTFEGARGRVTQRAHKDVRFYLDWVVTFDEPVGYHEWSGFGDDELFPLAVPLKERPVSVGALQHPQRTERRVVNEARESGDGSARLVKVIKPVRGW